MAHFNSFVLTLYAVSFAAVAASLTRGAWPMLVALTVIMACGSFVEEVLQRLERDDGTFQGVVMAALFGSGGAVPFALGFLRSDPLLFAGGVGLVVVGTILLQLALDGAHRNRFDRGRLLMLFIVLSSFLAFMAHMLNRVEPMRGFVLAVAGLVVAGGTAMAWSRKEDESILDLLQEIAAHD